MYSLASVKKIKELWYTGPTGVQLTLTVPTDLNQSLLKSANPNEYLVTPMSVSRDLAEAEVTTLKSGGDTIGFLIPGQALLSSNHQKNQNKLFGTYSLIAVLSALYKANEGDYSLFKTPTTNSSTDLFSPGYFYAVIWIKKLGMTKEDFYENYFVSLAKSGIYQTNEFKKSIQSTRTLSSYNTTLAIQPNKNWPDYISIITTQLSPYATDPYLRFFYLYQIIETLMAENYAANQALIRARFDLIPTPSITELKDFLAEFGAIVKEAPRINSALDPGCVDSIQSADAVLDRLGLNYTDWTFGAKIYKIRNTIFHDYKKIFHIPTEISKLEDYLMSFLLSKKLQ